MSNTAAVTNAIKGGKINEAKNLIRQGDVNADPELLNSLMGKGYDDGELAEMILNLGVNPNVLIYGEPALIRALTKGNVNIAMALVNAGATPNVVSTSGKTPMAYLADNYVRSKREGFVTLATILAPITDINRPTVYFSNPSLLMVPKSGVTPVMIAAFRNATPILEILINNGANLTARDSEGKSAILLAAEKGHSDVVEILLNNGINPDEQDTQGNTPLILAAKNSFTYGHLPTIRLLIERGANANIKNNEGMTALMLVAQQDHEGLLYYLISKGADVNIRNNSGKTVFDLMSPKQSKKLKEKVTHDSRLNYMLKATNKNTGYLMPQVPPGVDKNILNFLAGPYLGKNRTKDPYYSVPESIQRLRGKNTVIENPQQQFTSGNTVNEVPVVTPRRKCGPGSICPTMGGRRTRHRRRSTRRHRGQTRRHR